MDSQLFDQFLEDSWSAEHSVSKSINNTTSDLWPNDLWLNQYNPLAYNFEDFQSLDNQESYFKLEASSPPAFAMPSPISDSSSLSGVEDNFDQIPVVDPWVIPTALENNANTPTAAYNSPFEEDFSATTMIPNFASSPASSSSNSSWEPEQPDVKAKTTTMRARKQKQQQRSEKDSRAKPESPQCLKRQNSHNLIEKRYRNNLNTKINTLRDCIPSLRSPTIKEDEEAEDGMDSDTGKQAQKCNKGIILDKAIQYIAELENQVEKVSKENSGLQLMIKGSLPSYLRLGLRC